MQVGDDLLDALLVELQCLGGVIEDAEVVDDATEGLFREEPVGPADGLKEGVILQRLIEIHRLENGRVEAGEELGSDDEDLEGIFLGVEAFEKLLLDALVHGILLLEVEVVVRRGRDDDGAGVFAEEGIEDLLVLDAGVAVGGDDHGLEAVGGDLVLEVLGDVFDDGLDALGGLEEGGHLCCLFAEGIRFFVAEGGGFGELLEGFVDAVAIDVDVDEAGFEVQRQGGPVADGVLEGIARHVAAVVFLGTKGPEGVLVGLVDRGAGETEEEGVGQRGPHLAAEVAFLGAVGFVDHHDDVVPGIHVREGIAELVDGGDDDLAGAFLQQIMQLLDAVGGDDVGDIGGVEGAGDLGVEIGAVDEDEHGGALQLGGLA